MNDSLIMYRATFPTADDNDVMSYEFENPIVVTVTDGNFDFTIEGIRIQGHDITKAAELNDKLYNALKSLDKLPLSVKSMNKSEFMTSLENN